MFVPCLFISSLLLRVDVSDGQDVLAFIAKPWLITDDPQRVRIATSESLLQINCSTNDPLATVSLFINKSNKFEDTFSIMNGRVKQEKQIFSINNLQLSDGGVYRCLANNGIDNQTELTLGQLEVREANKVTYPELFPDVPLLEIERGANLTVVCKSFGVPSVRNSVLSWLIEVDLGVKKGFFPIAPTYVIRNETIVDSKVVDIDILFIKNFSRTNEGVYACRRIVTGEKETPTRKLKIQLKDDVPLKIMFPGLKNTTISVLQNTPVTVTCQSSGIPKPSTVWRKDGEVIKKCGVSINKCNLTLLSTIYPQDNGIYTCEIFNTFRKTSQEIDVQIQVPPIVKPFSKLLVANPNEDHELACEVERANPTPTILWEVQLGMCIRKNPLECLPSENLWKPLAVQEGLKSFIVSNKTTLNKFYRCTASNVIGKNSSITLLLRKEKITSQFRFNNTNPLVLNERKEFSVVCISDRFVYSRMVMKKNNRKLKTNNTLISRDKLLIYTVDAAKLSDNGTYECLARLLRNGEVRKLKLDVFVKKLIPVSIPFKEKKMQLLQDNVTDPTTLLCPATGNPAPLISWKFQGIKIKHEYTINNSTNCRNNDNGIYHLKDRPDVLIICSINYQKHSGPFECIARNIIKNKLRKEHATITLQVNAKPYFIEWTNTVAYNTGKKEFVDCSAHGQPLPNVTWYKISSDYNKTIRTGKGKVSLTFPKVKRKDAGVYSCVAKNKYGTMTKKLKINVFGEDGQESTSKKENLLEIVIGVCAAFFLVLFLFLLFVMWYKRHLKKRYALYLEPNVNFRLDPDRSLFDQSSELPYDMAWEFPREKLTFTKVLGTGAFGQVWLAQADGITDLQSRKKDLGSKKRRRSVQQNKSVISGLRKTSVLGMSFKKSIVAVKTLKDEFTKQQYKDLASELKILIHVGEHRNIVNLLGACTKGEKLCVILEYCPYGNLLSFLRKKRDAFEAVWQKQETDMSKEFTYIDLMKTAMDIARGMNFLESRRCVHRDLAARNVLVGNNYVMKIGDFGLARDLENEAFYLKETSGLVPLKWMAPESLFDKVYTAYSDVWSYGILLWELVSLGGSPYPGLPSDQLYKYLEDGKRMERPARCPRDIYAIMMSCWRRNPYDRPSFTEIIKTISVIMIENIPNVEKYIDFEEQKAENNCPKEVHGDNQSHYLEADFIDKKNEEADVPLLPTSFSYHSEISNFPLPELPEQGNGMQNGMNETCVEEIGF